MRKLLKKQGFIIRSNNGRRLERNRKFVDSPLEGTGFELLVAGAVKLVVAPFDAPGCLGTGPQPAERRDRALRE